MTPVFEVAQHPHFSSPYPLAYSRDKGGAPQEGGQVRFAWNDAGLYVSAELEDSCIIAQNRQDEQLHYEHVFELFVKPANEAYYWEMYATPNGNKSTLFFPSDRSGMELNDFLHGHAFNALEVGSTDGLSTFQGLENKEDEGSAFFHGWNTQMFVPVAQLTALGAGWGDGTEWTVFCGRYNYNSEDLADPELSMAPPLSATNYHLTHEYACLTLCKS